MIKRRASYFFLSVVLCNFLLTGCISLSMKSEAGRNQEAQPTPKTTPRSLEERRESIYLRGIEDRLEGTEVSRLKGQNLDSGDTEIRIWSNLRGLLFSRKGGVNSAIYVRPRPDDSTSACLQRLFEPKNGWDAFWGTVEARGISTMEDSGDIAKIDEGRSLFVEINEAGQYRSYLYPGVVEKKGGNYARLAAFARYIQQEFGINLLWEPVPNSPAICRD